MYISEVLKGVIFSDLVVSNHLVVDYPLILVVSHDKLKKITEGSPLSLDFINNLEIVRCLQCHFNNNRLVISDENS